MSLLEQASLVMIPSGYKEDVVYCPKPTDGSGDLTFTRASDGTRVNSAGLVENVPWNYLLDSSNLSSWYLYNVTRTTGVTDAYGTTNAVTISDISSGNYTDYLYSSASNMYLPTGTVVNYSVYLKGSGTIVVAIERAVGGTYFFEENVVTLSSTWNRYDFAYTIPVGVNASGLAFYIGNKTGTTATSVDICFPQVNYGSTAKPYFPTTDRQNVPRLTYEGGCPSLLLEPQRTNLATYSEQFDNAAWTKANASITANNTTSPDGTQNADKVVEDTANSAHGIYQSATITSGVSWTWSGFFKAAGRTKFRLYAQSASTPYVEFNLSNGTIISTSGSVTGSIESMGNGWYRCIATATTSGTTGYFNIAIADASGNVSYTGDGTSGIFVWGAQLEAGSYPTSYIPTTSAAVTRVADAAYKTGISSLIGQTEGTMFADFVCVNNSSYCDVISLGTDGTSGLVEMQINGGASNTLNAIYYLASGGGFVANIPALSTLTIGQRYKAAFAYKTNDFVFYLNGVQQGTDTSGTVSSGISEISLNGYGSGVNNRENSSINQAALFKTRLSNTELAALTTL